jgi:hypothetical protein
VCVCATFATWRVLRVTLDLSGLFKVLLANLMLGGTLMLALATGVPWLVATVLAGVCYPVWLVVCGVATLSEVRLVLHARGAQNAGALA